MEIAETPTSELIAEIQSRSIASVISLILPDSHDECTTKCYSHGHRHTRLGMLVAMQDTMRNRIQEEMGGDDGQD